MVRIFSLLSLLFEFEIIEYQINRLDYLNGVAAATTTWSGRLVRVKVFRYGHWFTR